MEITGLVPIMRRWAVVIIMATIIAGGIGLVLGLTATPTYESRSQLLIGPLNTDSDTLRASQQLASTYSEIAGSNPLLISVAGQLKVPVKEIRTGVRVRSDTATRLITIRVRNSNARTASMVANAIAKAMIQRTQGAVVRPEGSLTLTDPASVPKSPIAPRVRLIVPLAAASGLLGAVTLVLLIEYLSDSAKSEDEVEDLAGVVCLPVVSGRIGRNASTGLIARDASAKTLSDHRLVATHVELAASHMRCVLVVGLADDDGTGTLAANLATIYAGRRDRVTLVDAGVGEITRFAGLRDLPGLSEALAHPGTVGSFVSRPVAPVPAGIVGVGTSGRLEAVRVGDASRLIDELAGPPSDTPTDLVVVHAPSPLTSAAALVWARVADATILGVRRDRTRRDAVSAAATNLRTTGARLVAAVLHDASPPKASDRKEAPAPLDERVPEVAEPAPAVAPPARPAEPDYSPGQPFGPAPDAAPAGQPTKAAGANGGSTPRPRGNGNVKGGSRGSSRSGRSR